MRWLICVLVLLIPHTAVAAKKSPPKKKENCGSAEEAYKGLRGQYGEQPFAQFKDGEGHALYLFVNPQTWAWTIMQDTRNGKWCLVANGSDFHPPDRKHLDRLSGTHL